jgi:hypothetical protein
MSDDRALRPAGSPARRSLRALARNRAALAGGALLAAL